MPVFLCLIVPTEEFFRHRFIAALFFVVLFGTRCYFLYVYYAVCFAAHHYLFFVFLYLYLLNYPLFSEAVWQFLYGVAFERLLFLFCPAVLGRYPLLYSPRKNQIKRHLFSLTLNYNVSQLGQAIKCKQDYTLVP